MFDKLIQKFHAWRCKKRGHHIWAQYSYGGLGGTYTVTKCSCCGIEKPNSFQPEETYS